MVYVKALIVFAVFVGILYGLVTLLFAFDVPEWAGAIVYGLAIVIGAVMLERRRANRAG